MFKLKKVKPLFTRVITTARVYSVDELEGLVINPHKVQGSLKEYQEVLAIGESVRGINVGDLVKIDPSAYAVKKYNEGSLKDNVVKMNPTIKYNFNTLEIDDKPCLLLQDRDIEYVVEEYTDEKKSSLIHPNNDIILN